MSMQIRTIGQWNKVISQDISALFKKAVEQAVATEAIYMVALVHKGFGTEGLERKWEPLSKVTLALRKHRNFGGTKILQVSGTLKRSVTASKVGAGKWFVGVLRSARGPNGKPLINVAAVHEGPFPTLVPVTSKLRKWWMAMFLQGVVDYPLSPRRPVLVIMQRPFLRPAFEQLQRGSDARMRMAITAYLSKYNIAWK